MKRFCLILVIVGMGLLLCGTNSSATIINPDPAIFGDDDGTEIFTPSQTVVSIEFLDIPASFGIGSLFGFFFTNDPSNLVPIFGPDDQDLSGNGSDPQIAVIDFSAGVVVDVDDGGAQNFFTGTGDIGFFLFVDLPSDPFFLFTVPALNTSGTDAAATFPFLSDPSTYVIGFEVPNSDFLLTFVGVSGLTPIPEPEALLLLGSGFVGLAVYRRLKFKI